MVFWRAVRLILSVCVTAQWLWWSAEDIGSWFGYCDAAALSPSWHFFAISTSALWWINNVIAEIEKMAAP